MTDARTREWDEMMGQIAQEWSLTPSGDAEEERAKRMLRSYFVSHLHIGRPEPAKSTEGQNETQTP